RPQAATRPAAMTHEHRFFMAAALGYVVGPARHRGLLAVALCAVLASGASAGQRPQAQVVAGVVADITGAVLPDAQVELISAPANVVKTASTDGSGAFRFDDVPPGRYQIRVSFEGF